MAIVSTLQGAVRVLQLQRPEKKNALNSQMYLALVQALEEARDEAAIRAVLIQGQPGCFCAGHDIEDFLENPPLSQDSPVLHFLAAINTFPKPLLAAVAGQAVGVGATMLLHCDLVYADEQSRFSFPFVKLGLCPEAASTYLLPQLAGYQRAAEKLLLGDAFDMHEAQRMGMVNQILPSSQLHDFALQQATRLAALPADAVHACKRLMKQVPQLGAQMAAESACFRQLLAQPQAQAALQAFVQKRGTNPGN